MKRIFKSGKDQFGNIRTSALIASAASLVVLGLLTQCEQRSTSFRESKQRGACKQWFKDLEKDKKKVKKLRHAFVEALRESTKTTQEGMNTRKKLLDPSSDVVKGEILRIFNSDPSEPHFEPSFPAEAWFKYFEPDEQVTMEGTRRLKRDGEAEDHCLHIFYLPEVGAQLGNDEELIFETYLMCCYQPWIDN